MGTVEILDSEFRRLHGRGLALVRLVPPEKLYWQPRRPKPGALPVYSCGEHLLRAASAVEQTFGGVNANLWDDPFEWTLPEALPSPAHVEEYLGEAEAARLHAFARFSGDADLLKEVATPAGATRTLLALALETLSRASHHQGRAYATFRLFSDSRPPRI